MRSQTFLPLPGDLLVNLQEKQEQLTGLFEKLPAMFAQSQAVEVALGPALRAAMQVIQHIGGKMQVFSCTRPTIGEAKLKNREGGPRPCAGMSRSHALRAHGAALPPSCRPSRLRH